MTLLDMPIMEIERLVNGGTLHILNFPRRGVRYISPNGIKENLKRAKKELGGQFGGNNE